MPRGHLLSYTYPHSSILTLTHMREAGWNLESVQQATPSPRLYGL
ncbi:MAG: hypothetical protein ACAH88_16155 [Roseimicrobium sp.]